MLGHVGEEPEPEQEMDPAGIWACFRGAVENDFLVCEEGDQQAFGQLLDQGVNLVSTFMKTASLVWKAQHARVQCGLRLHHSLRTER